MFTLSAVSSSAVRYARPAALALTSLMGLVGCSNGSDAASGAPGSGGSAGAGGSGAAAGSGGAPDLPSAVRTFCGAARGRTIGGITVEEATLVASTASNPTYCLIAATVEPSIDFQVALPENWNRGLLFIGGGAYNGVIPPVESTFGGSLATGGGSLAAGYAVVGSDSGHRGAEPVPPLDGSWALNDPVAIEAYASSSTHRVLPVARAVVNECFGTPVERAYFEGCSGGGREALIEAQRWPDDFDGLIARAPAFAFTGIMTAFNKIARLVMAKGGTLAPTKLATLSRSELAACDSLDGAADGILSNPLGCAFDPSGLRCSGDDEPTCLTDRELESVLGARAATPLPYAQVDSLSELPGLIVGHEDHPAAWPTWVMGTAGYPPADFLFQEQFFKYFVSGDPNLDTLQISVEDHAERLAELSALLDATSPDLSAFSAHGGKLILWHGLMDAALTAKSTADYYERLVAEAGGRGAADAFVRFFPAPGVAHCGDGPGADAIDLVAALDAWVRRSAPPDQLIASHTVSETDPAPLTRPLCAYPSYPRYTGSGDLAVASSYACAEP